MYSILFFLLIISTFFFALTCTPSKTTTSFTPEQLQKSWEKEHLLHIVTQENIRRKDIAFLLIYYLDDLAVFFEERPSLYPVVKSDSSDTKDIDEEQYILGVLAIGWMRNFPDGNFYPDDIIKRSHLAIILHRVSGTLPLFPKKSPADLEIQDVPFSDYLYPSVTFAVSHNLLKLQDGVFGREEVVNGYEAARALSAFRKMLKK